MSIDGKRTLDRSVSKRPERERWKTLCNETLEHWTSPETLSGLSSLNIWIVPLYPTSILFSWIWFTRWSFFQPSLHAVDAVIEYIAPGRSMLIFIAVALLFRIFQFFLASTGCRKEFFLARFLSMKPSHMKCLQNRPYFDIISESHSSCFHTLLESEKRKKSSPKIQTQKSCNLFLSPFPMPLSRFVSMVLYCHF